MQNQHDDGMEPATIGVKPAARLVAQVTGERGHVVGSADKFQDAGHDEVQVRFEHRGRGGGELLPDEQVAPELPQQRGP